MDWFYAKHGKQEGPVPLETVRAKFKSGEIVPTDLVWREGMAEWTAAGSLPEVSAPDPVSPASAVEHPVSSEGRPASVGGASLDSSTGGPVIVSDDELGIPVAGSAMGAPQGTPGLATASLICGILALTLSCCGLGAFIGIAAVVCGHMQMGRYKRNPENETGKGLVIAGLITGYLGILIGLVMLAINLISFFAEMSKSV